MQLIKENLSTILDKLECRCGGGNGGENILNLLYQHSSHTYDNLVATLEKLSVEGGAAWDALGGVCYHLGAGDFCGGVACEGCPFNNKWTARECLRMLKES